MLNLINQVSVLDSLEDHVAEEMRNKDVQVESTRKRDLQLSYLLIAVRSGALAFRRWVSASEKSCRLRADLDRRFTSIHR